MLNNKQLRVEITAELWLLKAQICPHTGERVKTEYNTRKGQSCWIKLIALWATWKSTHIHTNLCTNCSLCTAVLWSPQLYLSASSTVVIKEWAHKCSLLWSY